MSAQIVHNPNWSVSALGTPIELYSFEPANATTSPILFIGGVHGDEPEGFWLGEDLLNWFLQLQANNKLLDSKPWLLVPAWNIDGFKNNQRTNGRGVDLNRNFPTPDWTAEHSKKRYYPGPFAASEPETQSLINLIVSKKPQLVLHFHSWEPCIVYTGAPGKSAAELFSQSSGYALSETIGYPTPGSLGEYAWLVHQTPVICIEENADKVERNTIWPRFESAFKKLLLS